VRASHPRMRSWFYPIYLNYGSFRCLRAASLLALQVRSSGVGQGGSPLCTDVIFARGSPRGSSASADATTVPEFWLRSENRGCSGDRTSGGTRVTTRGQRPW
jgi:hypothetical protein